jgi:hypothetical protein
VTNKYYIGMHSTDDLEDGYIGSGKRLWYSINKYGKERHFKEILEFMEDRESLKAREYEIVNEELLNDKMCMNLQLGGGGGFSNYEHMMKCSLAGAKSPGRIDKSKKAFIEKLKDPSYKKNFSDKIKEGIVGRPGNRAMLNKKHNNVTKQKMSDSHKKEKNSQYGTIWITDGNTNKKIKKTDIIPDGWNKGRTLIPR